MPMRALKTLNFERRAEIVKSALAILRKETPTKAYIHLKRLLKDGTERDLIFMRGIKAGVQLSALDKKDIAEIVRTLRQGVAREMDGKESGLLQKSELEKINNLLKPRFSLLTRKKVLTMLSRADALLLDGLAELLQKI
jgi:hypothetical protein